MGLSTLQYVKKLFPTCRIIYAIPHWIAPLYQQHDSKLFTTLPLRLNQLSDWFTLWRAVRKIWPDLIFELHQSGRTRKFFTAYSKVYRIPYFTHNHHLKGPGEVHDQGVTKPLIQRDLDGVWSFITKDRPYPNYLDYTPQFTFQSHTLNKSFKRPLVIFGVVATRETKCWPLINYAELAKQIEQQAPHYQVCIPLSPSEVDQNIKRELSPLLPANAFFLETGLDQLPEKLKGASLYIGNDTGLKHLAIALGIKTYTLFGPEPPLEWHPYDSGLHPYFFIEPLECRTREAHYCGLQRCDSMICLKDISVQEVFNAIKEHLTQ